MKEEKKKGKKTKGDIFYQSTVRGFAFPEGGHVVYYGKVYRIPRADFPHNMLKHETEPEDLLKDIEDAEPVPGAVLERHEVFDQDTGDVWVMWRIPYRQKAGKE